jgi:hypothetical protein
VNVEAAMNAKKRTAKKILRKEIPMISPLYTRIARRSFWPVPQPQARGS